MRKNPKVEPCWIGRFQDEWKLSPDWSCHLEVGWPGVYIGWLWSYYASDALAGVSDYKEDSAVYTDENKEAFIKLRRKKSSGSLWS